MSKKFYWTQSTRTSTIRWEMEYDNHEDQPVTIQITRQLPTMDMMTMVEKASVQSKSIKDQSISDVEMGLVVEMLPL